MFELFISDVLRLLHLLAVAVGFGVAVETETYMIRRRRAAIGPGLLAGLDHRHRVILCALGAMWVTGLALVALRTGFQLSEFTPKLWSKITVVTILTINAVFIAEVALPILAEQKGRPVAALRPAERRALFSVAGVSGASWLIALALGSSALLKVSPAPLFQIGLPLAYIGGIVVANIVGNRLYPVRAGMRRSAVPPPRRQGDAMPDAAARPGAPARSKPEARPAPALSARPPEPGPSRPARVVAPPAPTTVVRASDLAIAFPRKPAAAPRLRAGPPDTPERQAERERLMEVVAELGARR